MESLVKSSHFWKDRRVLITGHTGFKGSWLSLWLYHLGARVTGYALPPATIPSLFELAHIKACCDSHYGDIRDYELLSALCRKKQPEVVIHLAAQPLVRTSYRQPLETFATNIMGTAHLLDALRGIESVRSVVVVTTDKVYQNHEWRWPYREDDILGGHDPYSASKAASEIVVASYRQAFLADQGVAIATARAGNVMGGGDWSEDRLIPDAIRAWQSTGILQIRRPEAVRPWQHVIEPLAGYLSLAEYLWQSPRYAGSYNFGPETGSVATVRELITQAREIYGQGEIEFSPYEEGPHEAGWLALEISRARHCLGFKPRWSLPVTLDKTLNWYRAQRDGADAHTLCIHDIADYEATP